MSLMVNSAVSAEEWAQLVLAIDGNDCEAAKALVETQPKLLHHVDTTSDTIFHHTALWMAADCGRVTLIRMFIEKGASAAFVSNNFGNNSPLCKAVQLKDDTLAEATAAALIDAGADMEIRVPFSNMRTIFACAIVAGNLKTATMMVRKGADLHSKDLAGSTPLQDALFSEKQGVESFIEFIIEQGADDVDCLSPGAFASLRAKRLSYLAPASWHKVWDNVPKARTVFDKHLAALQAYCKPLLGINLSKIVLGYLPSYE